MSSTRDFLPGEVDDVIARVLRGDTERYAEIVRVFQNDILAITLAMLGSQQEAEDMTQQCFVSAFEHLHSYQLGTHFGRWLRAIARNTVRMEMRKHATRQRHLEAYREHVSARYELCEDRDAYECELQKALRQCRRELQDSHRDLLAMRYEGGLSFEAIGHLTGRTAQAVQRALSRIRLLLRDCVTARMEIA